MIDNNTRAAVAEDRKQIAERIRERARLFQADNGDPGALASTWGWLSRRLDRVHPSS
jgi:hypothetical protein